MTRVFEEHLLDDVVRSSLGFDLSPRARRKRLSRVGDREEGRRKEFARVEGRVRPGIYIYIYQLVSN